MATDDRSKAEITEAGRQLASAYQEYAKNWNPMNELLEAARAGDAIAAMRCDALFENWRKV